MPCAPDAKDLGRRVRRYLQTAEAYEILDAAIESGTWTAGGCWILAEVLSQLLRAPLVSVWGAHSGAIAQQHVVVQLADDCYLDADGAQSGRVLLRKMVEVEFVNAPYLAPFDKIAARENGLVCPARAVQRLHARLAQIVR